MTATGTKNSRLPAGLEPRRGLRGQLTLGPVFALALDEFDVVVAVLGG